MKELEEKITEINQFLKTKPWMDFELISLINGTLKIVGSADFSYYQEIEILFNNVFFLQCPDKWKSDTSANVLIVPPLEEQRNVNISYEIEQGYSLVKFVGEDIGPIYISCKTIEFNLDKKTY